METSFWQLYLVIWRWLYYFYFSFCRNIRGVKCRFGDVIYPKAAILVVMLTILGHVIVPAFSLLVLLAIPVHVPDVILARNRIRDAIFGPNLDISARFSSKAF